MFLYLEPEEIERIRRFGEVRSYGAGEALFRVGETGHGLFVVLSGHVDLIRHLESGALKTFLTQGPGAILGEIEEDGDFAELVLGAWLKTTEAGRTEAFDAIGRRLDDARRQHDDAKALDDALFGEDFETA